MNRASMFYVLTFQGWEQIQYLRQDQWLTKPHQRQNQPKKLNRYRLNPFEICWDLDNPTYLKLDLMYLYSYFPRMRADTILAIRPMAAKAPSTTKSTQKTKSSLIIWSWSLVRFGQSNGSSSLSKVALISISDMFDMVKLFCASASLKRIENVAIRQKLDKD